MADDVGFLGRWSRLKQQSVEGGRQPDEHPVAELGADASGEVKEVKPEALTDADLPALESLGEDADFSGFLSEGVSEALRKRALRQLFHGASYNVRDGLNEYDDDFSTFVPLGDTVTRQMKQWAEDAARKLLDGDVAKAEGAMPSEVSADPEPSADEAGERVVPVVVNGAEQVCDEPAGEGLSG